MSIKKLKDRNSEPDADTVAVLEEALEMAKSGRLRSVALAGSLTGHATFTSYATRDLQEAIGLVGFLHHTLCAKQRETPAT
jgi:hypothetical protein